MKYKIYFGILELIRSVAWLVMGALLAEYYDIHMSTIIAGLIR